MLLGLGLTLEAEAAALERAIAETLAAGGRTADLAGPGETALSCSAMTRAIVGRIAG